MTGIVFFLLGMLALFGDWASPPAMRFARAETLAENYVVYRNAVIGYVQSHPGASGTVGLSALSLPPGWQPLVTLGNRIQSGQVLVWGDLPSASQRDAERDSGWSQSMGVAEIKGGVEVGYSESGGTWFPVCSSVPVGALVSDVALD
ncbi:MAG: type IV pilus biogenesis protein PilM [Gammaproteobacteria bacterium]